MKTLLQTLNTNNSSTNSTFECKSTNKRPPAVINQFPENQTDFTSFRTVPGKKPYSNAMKTTYNEW